MRIPPTYDLKQAADPNKTAALPYYDACRALPGSREGRVDWLRGVADDKRIPAVHRLVLVRLGLGPREPRYDALAAEIGVGRSTVLGAIDIGVRRGWLADPKHSGPLLTFPTPPPEPATLPGGAP